jgi:hypothetical protein
VTEPNHYHNTKIIIMVDINKFIPPPVKET